MAGHASGADDAATPAAAPGFWSFLDGYLSPGGDGAASLDAKPLPASGEKRERDEIVSPTEVPGRPLPAFVQVFALGIDPGNNPAAASTAPSQLGTAASLPDSPAGNDAAAEIASGPPWGPLPGSALRLPDEPAPRPGSPHTEIALEPGAGAPPNPGELAFGARLLPQAADAGSGVEMLPRRAATANPVAAGAAPVWPAKEAGTAGMPLDDEPPLSGSGPLPPNSSGAAKAADGVSAPSLEQAGGPAIAAVGSAMGSHSRQPDDRGGDAPSRHTEALWNTVAAPAGRATPLADADPAPPPSTARAAPPEPPVPPAQPAPRDVSLRLADGPNRVDIRMAERAGEIRVTVHTPDRDLADSLRADLPDLVSTLRQNGYHAEAWRPAAAAQTDAGHQPGTDTPSQQDAPFNHRDGRQQQPRQHPRKPERWDGVWNSSLDPLQETQI